MMDDAIAKCRDGLTSVAEVSARDDGAVNTCRPSNIAL